MGGVGVKPSKWNETSYLEPYMSSGQVLGWSRILGVVLVYGTHVDPL